MKNLFKIFVAGFLGVSLYASTTIAVVNGHKITDDLIPIYSKLNKKEQNLIKQRLINEELLMEYALKSDVVKDPKFKKIFQAQLNQIKKKYKAKTGKDLTKEQIRNIKGTLAVKMLLAKKAQSFKISDKEAKEVYQKNKKKFMMPKSIELAVIVTKDKKEAQKILSKLKKSKNIPAEIMKIAKQKKQRGYLGWLPEQAFKKEIFKKLYNTKSNTLLKEPIKVDDKYHIIYVVNKRKEGIAKFDEVKDRLKILIAQEKAAKWAQNKIIELRKKADIK